MTIAKKLLILFPILGAGIIAVILALSDSEGRESYKRVVAVSQDRLLAVSRVTSRMTESSSGSGRCARLSLVRLDGVIDQTVEDCKGWIRVAGLGEGVVWLNSVDRGLHARRLGDLSLVPSVEEAIAAHPILSRPGRGNHKAYVLGMFEDQVVLEGADQRLYTVASNGTIEQRERGFEYTQRGSNENSAVPESVALGKPSVTRGTGAMTIRDMDGLVQPRIVVRNGQDDPVMLDEPESAIVVSMDVVGPTGRRQLSRVALDNEVLWTVGVRELTGPIDLGPPPAYRVVWVDVLDGALWALIEASARIRRTDADDYHRFGARLVRIDHHTGQALEVHELTQPE
jgi:hypothetical protein